MILIQTLKLKNILRLQMIIICYLPIILVSLILLSKTKKSIINQEQITFQNHFDSNINSFKSRLNHIDENVWFYIQTINLHEKTIEQIKQSMTLYLKHHSQIDSISFHSKTNKKHSFHIQQVKNQTTQRKQPHNKIIYEKKFDLESHYIKYYLSLNTIINFFPKITNEYYLIESKDHLLYNKKSKDLSKLISKSNQEIPLGKIINRQIIQSLYLMKKSSLNLISAEFYNEVYFYSVKEIKNLPFIEDILIKYIAIIFLVIVLAVFFIYVFFNLHVLKPIQILSDAIHKAYQKKLNVMTNIRTNNEIGFLSFEIDQMLSKLYSTQNKLKKQIQLKNKAQVKLKSLNQTLEKKIHQRARKIIKLNTFLSQILSSLTSGIIVLDKHKQLKFLNHFGKIILQIDPQEKNISSKNLPVKIINRLTASFETQKSLDSEELEIIINSQKKIFGLKTCFIKSKDKINHMVAIFNDISSRKKLEQELIESEKFYSCGLISTGMAHDFNNLLNRIRLSVDILKKLELNEEQTEFIEEIQETVKESQSLTHSLLSFANPQKLELIPIDIYSALKTFEHKMKKTFRKHKVLFDIHQKDKQIHVMAEPQHFQQVLTNLASNAIQAFNNQPSWIKIHTLTIGDKVLIFFRDYGPGIPKDTVLKIFEPFFSTKKYSLKSGWGLGLALVKRLVENMNGCIRVKSILNTGTVFLIVFSKKT